MLNATDSMAMACSTIMVQAKLLPNTDLTVYLMFSHKCCAMNNIRLKAHKQLKLECSIASAQSSNVCTFPH